MNLSPETIADLKWILSNAGLILFGTILVIITPIAIYITFWIMVFFLGGFEIAHA